MVYQVISATQCPTRNAAPRIRPPSSPAITIAFPMDNHQTQKKGFAMLVSTPDRYTCLIPLSLTGSPPGFAMRTPSVSVPERLKARFPRIVRIPKITRFNPPNAAISHEYWPATVIRPKMIRIKTTNSTRQWPAMIAGPAYHPCSNEALMVATSVRPRGQRPGKPDRKCDKQHLLEGIHGWFPGILFIVFTVWDILLPEPGVFHRCPGIIQALGQHNCGSSAGSGSRMYRGFPMDFSIWSIPGLPVPFHPSYTISLRFIRFTERKKRTVVTIAIHARLRIMKGENRVSVIPRQILTTFVRGRTT